MKNNIQKFSFQLYRIEFKFLKSFKKMKFVLQIGGVSMTNSARTLREHGGV